MFRLFLLAGLLPLSRLHALFPPGPISLVVSLLVVALFWTFILRRLLLPMVFGRDVILHSVNGRLLLLYTVFFALQFMSLLHAYLNSVIDLLFMTRSIVWWLTVYLFTLAVFLTHESRSEFLRLRAALFAGPVIYTLLNAGLYVIGFERLEVAGFFNWDIKNVMLGLFGIDAIVPFYPLSSAPRSLAIVAAVATVVCIGSMHLAHSRWSRAGLFVTGLICFAVILTTDSRMAVIALIVAIAGHALMRLSRTEKALRLAPAITPLFPLIILQVAVLVAVLDVSDALSRQRFDNISTLSGRSELWEFVYDEISDPKAIHLIGYGQFGQVTAGIGEKYSYIFEAQNGDITRKTAHNMVLQTFLDTGYVGVVLLLLLLYEVTKIATQSRSAYHRIYSQVLLLVFVDGITSAVPTLMSIEISTFFYVFLGMFASQYVAAANTSSSRKGNPLVRSSWAGKLSP